MLLPEVYKVEEVDMPQKIGLFFKFSLPKTLCFCYFDLQEDMKIHKKPDKGLLRSCTFFIELKLLEN